ncbi:oxidized low-density lipoprotein receptor 1-like [Clarias gariepinus]|uniref:oxidized low-density lipoprotein receptor 1-like n=1 Tax=Clarias gariepinus TaxID=13013 RepID=UPI00234E3169|nr:oxidized low-density lipoprotein receptor 1-like [Clarias gariepinus]
MSKLFAVFRRKQDHILQKPKEPIDTSPKDELACLKVEQESELNQMDYKKKIDDMLQEYMEQIEGQDKLMQVNQVGKKVKNTDMTVHRLKDDLKSIQDKHKNAVSKISELKKEREEQNKIIVTQKNQISSLLTQLDVCRKEYEGNIFKLEEQLKQSRQEQDQKKNLVKEHELLQKKAEESKTLIKKVRSLTSAVA